MSRRPIAARGHARRPDRARPRAAARAPPISASSAWRRRLQRPPLMGSVPQTEDAAITAGQERAPGAIAAWHRVRSAQYAVDSAFGDLLPTINIVGSWSRTYDSQIRGDRLDTKSIQLQASVPIYQNGAEYSRVRAAKQTVGQRLAELDGARRQAAETAVRAFRQYEARAPRQIDQRADPGRQRGAGGRAGSAVGSRAHARRAERRAGMLNAQCSWYRRSATSWWPLHAAVGHRQLTARAWRCRSSTTRSATTERARRLDRHGHQIPVERPRRGRRGRCP